MEVRPAEPDELLTVMTVLDAGGLDVDADRVWAGISAKEVLVAVDAGRLLGALLLTRDADDSATEIDAIAVRPGRRGQGIGRGLVRAAAERHDRLVAEFDPAVRPFWVSLGFEIEPAEEPGRFVGWLDGRSAAT